MKGLTRRALGYADKKMDEAYNDNEKHPYVKASIAGFIEGAIDGAVIMYPVLLIGCYYWRNKATK